MNLIEELREIVDKESDTFKAEMEKHFEMIDKYIIENAKNGEFKSMIYYQHDKTGGFNQYKKSQFADIKLALCVGLNGSYADIAAAMTRDHYNKIGLNAKIVLDDQDGGRTSMVRIKCYHILDEVLKLKYNGGLE